MDLILFSTKREIHKEVSDVVPEYFPGPPVRCAVGKILRHNITNGFLMSVLHSGVSHLFPFRTEK